MRTPRLPPRFLNQVYRVVRAIPPGRVMTYGWIAALVPPPAGTDVHGYERVRARWVGYAMAACPEDVPWQRVVNASGRISPRPDEGPELQRLLLLDEGVVFEDGDHIDLSRFGWEPPAEWYARNPDLLPPANTSRSLGGTRQRKSA